VILNVSGVISAQEIIPENVRFWKAKS